MSPTGPLGSQEGIVAFLCFLPLQWAPREQGIKRCGKIPGIKTSSSYFYSQVVNLKQLMKDAGGKHLPPKPWSRPCSIPSHNTVLPRSTLSLLSMGSARPGVAGEGRGENAWRSLLLLPSNSYPFFKAQFNCLKLPQSPKHIARDDHILFL